MKKRFILKIVLISILCLVIAGVVTALAKENPKTNIASPNQNNIIESDTNQIPPDPNNATGGVADQVIPPPQHNDYPEPLYKANKDAQGVTFLSKEEIIENLNLEEINKTRNDNRSVKSIVMKTYAQYMAEDDPNSRDFEIDPNRVVWVVVEDCPNGIDTKGGFYEDATLKLLIDAETGHTFGSIVSGTCTSFGIGELLKKRMEERNRK